MPDLDTDLRTIVHALVAEAPTPPSFPIAASASAPRRLRWVAFAVATAAAATVAAVAVVDSNETTTVDSTGTASAPVPSTTTCGTDLPLSITATAATGGAVAGPAPGRPAAIPGQFVQHWPTADGAVEVRWPAAAQPLYGDPSDASTLGASEAFSPARVEIDVHPYGGGGGGGVEAFRPDVVVERLGHVAPTLTAPCDVVQLLVLTEGGLWVGGMEPVHEAAGVPVSRVDLQPRIIERRTVDDAPDTAVTCRGSDRFGTPPNRSGGPDPALRGARPADVLLAYLAANPSAPPSGYVELTDDNGLITYAVAPSADGWTTLVFVARDGEGWRLEGWAASGC